MPSDHTACVFFRERSIDPLSRGPQVRSSQHGFEFFQVDALGGEAARARRRALTWAQGAQVSCFPARCTVRHLRLSPVLTLPVVVKRIDNAHDDCIWSVAWSKVNTPPFSRLAHGVNLASGPNCERFPGREGQDMVRLASSLKLMLTRCLVGLAMTSTRSISSRVTPGAS